MNRRAELLTRLTKRGFLPNDAALRAELETAWDETPDADLAGLLLDRRRLLKQLALVLTRVGASHPQRAKVNTKRSLSRKAVRKALRLNADAIAARTLELDDARR